MYGDRERIGFPLKKNVPPVGVASPTKKNVISPIFCTNVRLEAPPLPNPSLCHNFSYTSDPKMHHPAMDS